VFNDAVEFKKKRNKNSHIRCMTYTGDKFIFIMFVLTPKINF